MKKNKHSPLAYAGILASALLTTTVVGAMALQDYTKDDELKSMIKEVDHHTTTLRILSGGTWMDSPSRVYTVVKEGKSTAIVVKWEEYGTQRVCYTVFRPNTDEMHKISLLCSDKEDASGQLELRASPAR